MYLWFIVNNFKYSIWSIEHVVKGFQNVSLIYSQQPTDQCEVYQRSLWKGFKMYLWFIVNNFKEQHTAWSCVVKGFQNVSLIYSQQPTCLIYQVDGLLWKGFKMYLWFIVNNNELLEKRQKYVVKGFQNVSLIYSQQQLANFVYRFDVVKGFQNVSLIYSQQPGRYTMPLCTRCERVSKCIFDL